MQKTIKQYTVSKEGLQENTYSPFLLLLFGLYRLYKLHRLYKLYKAYYNAYMEQITRPGGLFEERTQPLLSPPSNRKNLLKPFSTWLEIFRDLFCSPV